MIRTKGFATFDRSIIKSNWRKINETPVKRAGLLVRRYAVNSIKKVKTDTPSPPGRPPKSRAPGHPMKLIFSVPNSSHTGVVVGPVGFGGSDPVPRRLEFGTKFSISQSRRAAMAYLINRRAKLSGPLGRHYRVLQRKIGGPPRQGRNSRGQFTQKRQQPLEPADIKPTAVIRPRPYMGPALIKAAPKIPTFWRGSLGGG